jgi:cytochrome c6
MKQPLHCLLVLGVAAFGTASLSFAQSSGNLSYKAKCQMCHGATGLGDTQPGRALNVQPFTSSAVQAMSDAALIGIIRNGQGKMPAYQGKLPDAEINNLIQYIHQLQTNHQ